MSRNRADILFRTRLLGLDLTPRELEVARMLASGLSCPEISRALGISSKTADSHRQSVLGKLGCRNNVDLALHGVREGWISIHE